MKKVDLAELFSSDRLAELFPADRADAFFDALYGDAEEGAYDIRLAFKGQSANRLLFAFELMQRPGHCLVCNLTYGLPQVFARHPIIGLPAMISAIADMLELPVESLKWELGNTEEHSRELHSIPLRVTIP